jgi:proton glutamate symport protein
MRDGLPRRETHSTCARPGAVVSTPVAARGNTHGGASRAWLVLGALVAGIVAGAAMSQVADGVREPLQQVFGLLGGLWLDALKMVVIPLIVGLLIVGVAKGTEAARTGPVAGRSMLWFGCVYVGSAVIGLLLMMVFLDLFPLPERAAGALRAGLATIDQDAVARSVPAAGDFVRSLIPANVIDAAARGNVLQLVVFSLLFALAVSRIEASRRERVVEFFAGVVDALLVVIGWVLWIAPLGIFALAFTLGAGGGGAVLAAVLHYVVLVSALGVVVLLAGYAIAVVGGGLPLRAFARAMIAPQAVAISTQSSLASLPAMLAATRMLGLRARVVDVTLPLAVALFRATGPAMNIGVAYYVGHWLGLDPGIEQLIAATAVAAVVSAGSVSLPGQISFLTSIAPIAMAMGVPIAPLAILVAVENIPDMFRTVGNVTANVAVASAVDRHESDVPGATGA